MPARRERDKAGRNERGAGGGEEARVHPWGCGEKGVFGGAATPGVREGGFLRTQGWGVMRGGGGGAGTAPGAGWRYVSYREENPWVKFGDMQLRGESFGEQREVEVQIWG